MTPFWLYIILSMIVGAMLVVAVLGLALAAIMPGLDRWNRHFFMSFFGILALSVFCMLIEPLSYDIPAMAPMVQTSSFFSTFFLSVTIVMPLSYLLHCCNEDWRTSALFRIVGALWATFVVLLVTAQFTTFIYYYTQGNVFNLGPWYPVPIALLVVMTALIQVGVVRRREKLSRKHVHAFFFFFVPLTIALAWHTFTPVFSLIYVSTTIASLAMFVIVVSEQIEQYISLEREAARQRTKIAVLRMRPHFIHNTMTSIYYLCDQDPKKAQQVTMDFNTYLRKNFNAIAKDEAIPFSGELEHTRAYLAVEQAQFENKLIIDYDVTYTLFRIPPLTLQPLAENSVKHGMSPSTIPLHVIIRTRKEESACKVIVEDSGPGCDPAVVGDPSTTLANIRERLALMCEGTLEIAPREGGGTIVTVTVPNP